MRAVRRGKRHSFRLDRLLFMALRYCVVLFARLGEVQQEDFVPGSKLLRAPMR